MRRGEEEGGERRLGAGSRCWRVLWEAKLSSATRYRRKRQITQVALLILARGPPRQALRRIQFLISPHLQRKRVLHLPTRKRVLLNLRQRPHSHPPFRLRKPHLRRRRIIRRGLLPPHPLERRRIHETGFEAVGRGGSSEVGRGGDSQVKRRVREEDQGWGRALASEEGGGIDDKVRVGGAVELEEGVVRREVGREVCDLGRGDGGRVAGFGSRW